MSRSLRIAALAVGLGIPALLGFTLQQQYAHALAEAEIRATNTVRALEEHAARTLETIDTYLRAVASLVGPRTGSLPPETLHAALNEQVGRSRLFNISVINQDGRAVAEAGAFPARPLDVNDRAYFRTLRDEPGDGLVIGQPLTGRLTGKLLIPVGRRIEGPEGAFAGIVQGMLDPQTFQAVYGAIDNGPGAVLTLWRADGTLLVRSPEMPGTIGRNYASGANYQRHVVPRDRKPFWSTGSTDGAERVFALGFPGGYPIVVGAALGRDDALADWRRSAVTQAVGGGGLALVLVAALLLLAREIERRKVADAQIRASEERYRLLAENTSDLIVFKPTMTGHRGYVSPAVRTILGWEPDEYAALPPDVVVPPDDLAALRVVYETLTPEGPQAIHVHRVRHKAGHYVWIESVFKLVGDRKVGRTVVITSRDVTARRTADAALRESEARYRLLSEATTDMVTHMDLSGRRLYVSPASRDLFGYEPHELVGTRPQQGVHPDDAESLESLFADLTAGRRERGISMNRQRHRDGRWIWVEASLRRLLDAHGATTGFVSSVRNIEARKADEAALLAAREAAERASAAKGEFLATMSHEIRTPLNGVIGYADLLRDEPNLDATARLHVDRIRSSGAALLTVVNDVLDFSKIEAGQVEIESRPFGLSALIDDAFAIVRGAAEDKGLPVNVTLASGLPDWVWGDKDRLRQVLLNLLNNAIKFTDAGWIGLSVGAGAAAEGHARLRFSVADTGIGVPQDRRDRLFQRFSQADGSIGRTYGGTGLGLAICKSLVERMGGTIGFETEEGDGSTFWFEVELPVAVPGQAQAAQVHGPILRRPRRLLLAEDVELNRDLACAVLRRVGHTVDVVADGAAAVAAVQAHVYELVLMDVQMPVLDGLAAIRRIRALGGPEARVPIVAMTAHVMPEQVDEALAAGADGHVGKPFQVDALLDTIDRLGRDVGAGRGHPSASTVDRATLEQLAKLVGHERVGKLLGDLSKELERRFGDAGTTPDRDDLIRDAHAMVSAAAMLGFPGLAQACREAEVACRAGEDYRPPLARLRERCTATLVEIAALRAA